MSDPRYDHNTLLAFVRGKLPEATAHEIETACETDNELAADIAVLRGVIAASAERAAETSATEFGWARLSKAIGETATGAQKRLEKERGPRFALWQVAAAAVAAVAVWQAVAVPMLTRPDDPGPAYITVSGDESTDTQAKILFRDDAFEGDIRVLLREVEARIIDGPSAIGFYTVSFESPAARMEALKLFETPGSPVELVQID